MWFASKSSRWIGRGACACRCATSTRHSAQGWRGDDARRAAARCVHTHSCDPGARFTRGAPSSLRINVLVAILVVAGSNRRQCFEGLIPGRAGARRSNLRLLTHDLLQVLLQVTAHKTLRAGTVGPDHVDHEILTEHGLNEMFLFGNDLQ